MFEITKNSKLYTAKETSEILGISRAMLSRIKHIIGYYRIGNRIKFGQENIENYLESVAIGDVVIERYRTETGGNH